MLDSVHMTSLFENATEGIILTDQTGKILLTNPALETMFGYTGDELLQQSIEILVPQKFQKNHQGLRKGFYKKPANRPMGKGLDLYGKRKDGTDLPVEVSLCHYTLKGKMFVIAFIVDITERKKIEKDLLHQKAALEKITQKVTQLNTQLEKKVEERTLILKEALQRLEQSQQELSDALDKERQLNEIKSRFVSMASHEFRTPLTTVLSSASLLSKYKKSDEQDKRDRHIMRIKSAVNNLNEILEDFLSLGKFNEGKIGMVYEPTNFKTLITETIEELSAILKKGQRIDLAQVENFDGETDVKLFRNIIINLVSNAVKFSAENDVVTLIGKKENGKGKFSVKDEGIGIPEKDQQHLFSSFFRADNVNNIQGTGLGLHIVKRYLNIMKGDVSVESVLNKGTKVTFTIPLKKDTNEVDISH